MPLDFMVGPYRILERLGAGGMGEVLLAEDTRLGRRVALKRLSNQSLGSDDQRQRLLDEASSIAALNHPNIAAVYDVLDAEGVAHIVMEYVDGETLAARLLRGPLTPDALLRMARQLCDGLAAAHAQHVVHRDLKPSNVLLTRDHRVKILDFGVARRDAAAVDLAAPATRAPSLDQQIVGTPAYMAPEQLLGGPVDHRADIYSLGVTLYQLATGRLPFDGDSFMSVALSVLTGPVPDVEGELGSGIGSLIARAMAREPSDRYQSAAAMAEDIVRLLALMDETPTRAVPPMAHALRARRYRRFAVASMLVLIVVLAGLLWWALAPAVAARPAGLPVVAVLPLETSSADPKDATLGYGVGHALVSDLAGTRGLLVVTSSPGQSGSRRADDVSRIARSVGASYIVDGGVQVVGEQVRINLRLMRPDGAALHGWTEQGARSDLLRLQRNVALALVDFFAVRLSAAERERIERDPPPDIEALRLYSDARALFERRDVEGNLQRAIDLLAATVAREPSFALAHAALSEAYWAQYTATKDERLVDQAIAAAQRALQLDPLQPDVRYAIALIHKGTGQLERAGEQLQQSIASTPHHDGTRRLLGEVRAGQGRVEEAIAEIEQAIRIRPGYAPNHTSLGLVYLEAGRYQEAVNAFAQATRLEPHSPDAHTRLGAAYHYLGNERAARAEYRQAVQLGGSASAHSNLALLEYRAGRYREAAAGYEQANRLGPNDPLRLRNLGDAYRRLGREADALAAYEQGLGITERMLTVNPTNVRTLQTRAVLLAKVGRNAEAVTLADQVSTLAPGDPDALYERALVLAINRDTPAALEALERALNAGFPAREVRHDDEWADVANSGRFRELVDRP